jgi:hypothetical protein
MTDGSPPEVEIFRLSGGLAVSRMLYVIAERGIADLLGEGPLTCAELAQAAGLHEPSLYRVLRSLASLGVFTERPGRRFALTPLAETLRTSHPSGGREAVLTRAGERAWRQWGEFPRVVATGRSGMELAFGVSLFDYLEQHPEEGAAFNRMMLAAHGAEPPAVVEAYDFSGLGTIVDVGGGIGTLLAAVLRANPAAHGVLLDREGAIREARAAFTEQGLAHRCRFVVGDFFQRVPPAGDAYLLSHVIHDWDEERCASVLRNCRDAMGPDSRLLLVEMVLPPGDMPHPGTLLDMAMLVGTGGMERTRDEYEELLRRSGFRLTDVVPTASDVSVIEAIPA